MCRVQYHMASSQQKGHSLTAKPDANAKSQQSPTLSSIPTPLQVSDFVSPTGIVETFTPDRILALQRTIGNSAVQRLLEQRADAPLPTLRGQSSVARDTYDTKGVELDRTDIEDVATGSYWEQKVLAVFNMITFDTVGARFKKDAEELTYLPDHHDLDGRPRGLQSNPCHRAGLSEFRLPLDG